MNLPDLSRIREFAIDTETWDPHLQDLGPGFVYGQAKVIGISVYCDNGYNEYFPLRHTEGNINYGELKPWLIELLGDPLRMAIFANARYDLEALYSLGIDVKNFCIDIQVLEALIDEERKSYSLSSLTKIYNLPEKSREAIEKALLRGGYYQEKTGKPDWSKLYKLPADLVGEYAKYDAKATYDVFQCQKPIIAEEELKEVAELESQLIPVLHDMRIAGVPVDIPRAEEENSRILRETEVMLGQIHSLFPDLNVFSPLQLAEVVRERGHITAKTEKGGDSVSNEFLLSVDDEFLNLIGNYRQHEKIRRDFIEGLILNGSYKGRVHPQWFQTRGSSFLSGDDTGGTRSGRIACSNPNLAQIPSRHPVLGPLVRSLFIPESGASWFKGDLSQQEPRIGLHYAYVLKLTGAEKARQIYLDNPNTDYHTMVMNMVNAVRSTPIARNQAKTINLGVAYGMGKKKLADALRMPMTQAKGLLEDYDRGFPFIKELMQIAMEYASERGYVKTILGRRRRFDMWEPPYFQRGKFPIKGKEAAMKAYGTVRLAHLHKAMNSIIQGTAAEQMKKALVQVHAERIPLHITLYDEIGASAVNEAEARRIKEIAENAIKFEVPQVMEWKMLTSWGGK